MTPPNGSTAFTPNTLPALTPYFPNADTSTDPFDHKRPLPPPPPDPVFDCSLSKQFPLDAFDQSVHNSAYGPRQDGVEADLPPSEHSDGSCRLFLMPSLTKNERLRLTMLWYYAADIMKNEEFLMRLQERLDLVREFFSAYECAVIGLMSEDVYTRIVTTGIPLAIVPRRETICAHTINQNPGTAFMLHDMENDWRFQQNPAVEITGLRSYAGAQLRCRLPDDQQVALGTLCIVSSTPQSPLGPEQQASLVRFADIFTSEIVSHSRESRRRQRHRLGQLLTECRPDSESPGLFEAQVTAMVQTEYPKSSVEFRIAVDGVIHAPGLTDILTRDVKEGLWEDTELIEDLIVHQNHAKLETCRTVRAVVCVCQALPVPRYLVVSTKRVQTVYDDVDAWFIGQCAATYCSFIQNAQLREALQAKDIFLRGITHQLRTPIHGVLGSVDLLAEELASRNLLLEDQTIVNRFANPSSALKTIRESGRELMSTVNNILKLNRWAEAMGAPKSAPIRALSQLEADILYDISQIIPEKESDVVIFFDNQLASSEGTVTISFPVVKECIQALVINALTYTEKGSVVVVISAPRGHSKLVFDIFDTGCGIPEDDRARIFEAYEKVDSHTRGAGLGLTLAAKIARAIEGSVTLVSTSQGPKDHGSHFRAVFENVRLTGDSIRPVMPLMSLMPHDKIGTSFHVLQTGSRRHQVLRHFASYLCNQGFRQSGISDSTFIIVSHDTEISQLEELAKGIDRSQAVVCLLPADAVIDASFSNKPNLRFLTGPFVSSRLEEIVKELHAIEKKLSASTEPSTNGTTSPTPLMTSHDDPILTISEPTAPAVDITEPVALLVDDNDVNLRILRMYCEKRGIPYATAVNGAEAIASFDAARQPPLKAVTLVLMDMQMPVCDGMEATAQIRARDQVVTVLMITGQDSAADRAQALEAGANGFYVKPMSIRTLDAAVGKYFPAFRKRLECIKKRSKQT